MATYAFTFPAEAAGLWATAYDILGNPVATGVLFENAEQKAVISFDLPEGTYSARVGGVDHDESSVRRDDSVPEVNLPGTTYIFGADSGGSIPANSAGTKTAFDDTPDGFDAGDEWTIPAGLYFAYIEFDFDEPELETHVMVQVNGGGSSPNVNGPFTITPGGLLEWGRTLKITTPVINQGTSTFAITVSTTVDSGAVDPEPLTFSYAWVALTKIA